MYKPRQDKRNYKELAVSRHQGKERKRSPKMGFSQTIARIGSIDTSPVSPRGALGLQSSARQEDQVQRPEGDSGQSLIGEIVTV